MEAKTFGSKAKHTHTYTHIHTKNGQSLLLSFSLAFPLYLPITFYSTLAKHVKLYLKLPKFYFNPLPL